MNRRKFIGVSSAMLPVLGMKKAFAAPAPVPNSGADSTPPVFPEFDLSSIPFSYRGSYLTIGKANNSPVSRLVVNTVRRSAISHKWFETWSNNLFEIALFKDGKEIEFSTRAEPWLLTLSGEGASAQIVFADADSFVIHTSNCAVHLLPVRNFSWKYLPGKGAVVAYDSQSDHYHYLHTYDHKPVNFGKRKATELNTEIDTIESGQGVDSSVLVSILTEETKLTPVLKHYRTHEQERRKEVGAWMSQAPACLPEHQSAVLTGWFLFWNLQVAPWRNYSRQSVLSSKKSMSMIWSWDICFNALALVKADYGLAWDQLFAILDKQRENGLLPDVVNDLQSNFGFNKPPVWGWTVMKMLEHTPKPAWTKLLSEAYPKIAKFNAWWFENRNLGGKGICAYMHGNDSGWDNATLFDSRLPVESPDLTAFLILETEALSFMANYLGKTEESKKYATLAAAQLELFGKNFIGQSGFTARALTPDGPKEIVSQSLLLRVPLVLGKRLPATVVSHVARELSEEGAFLTANGVASESVKSDKYEPNGYWRGPVWAPSTYLIFDGLIACGQKELANVIAKRFCDMVSKTSTFNENYNALTGIGQYDSGLT